ncbi:MAG: class I SAM-dependent methyltransferase [Anaerolineales bacterium]
MTPSGNDRVLWNHLLDLPYFRALLRAVEDGFYQGLTLPEPTLDIGCGDGHFASVAFSRRIDVGLDPSFLVLPEAKRRGGYRLVVQGDGMRIPFPTAWFASAMSNSVLEHIPRVDEVVVEIGRVLKPGAPFVFCVPNPRYLSYLSVARILAAVGLQRAAGYYRDWFRRMSRTYNLDEAEGWRARLDRAGLVLESSWDYFSESSLRTLEWGHYLGLPCLVARKLTGRWILWKSKINLALTWRLVSPHFHEATPAQGAYTFYVARRA